MKQDHYILGNGMAAGGLQSVAEFFGAFNTSVPLSVVSAAQLHEGFHGKLLDILCDKSAMKVRELTADGEMHGGTIYVAANGLEVLIEGKLLKVRKQKDEKRVINNLFNSMAASRDGQMIGMILSGTGTDGVEGLKAISEVGGLVLVQEPFSALYQSLPRLAIKSDHPDKILPPVRLAVWLNKFLTNTLSNQVPRGGSASPAA